MVDVNQNHKDFNDMAKNRERITNVNDLREELARIRRAVPAGGREVLIRLLREALEEEEATLLVYVDKKLRT